MMTKKPKVSIGLAVFNGENYLKTAIDSILSQTFSDFELIISDNASTDRTEEICRQYAQQDCRIRYYRNSTNIGGSNNENQTFKLARGEYFRLAAHDDFLAPTLIEKCVEVLERNPSIILCYSTTIKIDERGKSLDAIAQDVATSTVPHKRFRDLAKHHDCELAYGLVRTDILRKTELQPNYPESDFGFLCELSLYGQFYRIPEPLFYRRYHAEMSGFAYPELLKKMTWHQLNAETQAQKTPSFIDIIKFFFYYQGIQIAHYHRIIARAQLNFGDRLFCYFHTTKWLISRPIRQFLNKTWYLRQKLLLTKQAWSELAKRSFL
jgi:glycosyltransferase involved in cell wall biosynthesis